MSVGDYVASGTASLSLLASGLACWLALRSTRAAEYSARAGERSALAAEEAAQAGERSAAAAESALGIERERDEIERLRHLANQKAQLRVATRLVGITMSVTIRNDGPSPVRNMSFTLATPDHGKMVPTVSPKSLEKLSHVTLDAGEYVDVPLKEPKWRHRARRIDVELSWCDDEGDKRETFRCFFGY
ncbi:hypothetical protein ABT063_05000 [Streptomyces sp. NPDC002838]|uniref:hypothetical protein n=1 Tax=Streptomyces sp. NPDC002838 TaxID=3154436 RepID=UPI00332E5C1D